MLFGAKAEKSIGAEGARMISEGLKINSTLTKLNLTCDIMKWNKERTIKEKFEMNREQRQG